MTTSQPIPPEKPDSASPPRAPQRLVILCDGTWDTRFTVQAAYRPPESALPTTQTDPFAEYYTNVALLNLAIPPSATCSTTGRTIRQVCYYQTGIGTSQRTALGIALTGATGSSLPEKVREAYGFLCDNYSPGDEIFLFGFSRGAYTARSIGGFLSWAGILQKASCHHQEHGGAEGVVNESIYFNEIYNAYMSRVPGDEVTIRKAAQVMFDKLGRWPSSEADRWSDNNAFAGNAAAATASQQTTTAAQVNSKDLESGTVTSSDASYGRPKPGDQITVPPEVQVIGVWDTVGALGVPGFFRDSTKFQFLDPGLPDNVRHGFQALALEEDRQDFLPTIWYAPSPEQEAKHGGPGRRAGQVLKQTWFLGSHGDVGGGKVTHGLASISLAWMVAQVTDTKRSASTPGGDAGNPLLHVDLDVIKSLQDRRHPWAKSSPYRSRSVFSWQETRKVLAPKNQSEGNENEEWANNVYTGISNESIHHSVVVCGRLNAFSPPFAALKKKGDGEFDKLWNQSANVDSLSPTEKRLRWEGGATARPSRSPLKLLIGFDKLVTRAVSDTINFKIIPRKQQENLQLGPLGSWAQTKLWRKQGLQ